MQYILDANVFITSHRSYYAFDIAPGFWRSIIELAKDDAIIIPMMVKKEILDGEDNLSAWLKENSDICYGDPTNEIGNAYSGIADFVNLAYEPQNVDPFLKGADPWVIAHGQAMRAKVITDEKIINLKKNNKTGQYQQRIKIPNICKEFKVECGNTFDLIRELNIKLS